MGAKLPHGRYAERVNRCRECACPIEGEGRIYLFGVGIDPRRRWVCGPACAEAVRQRDAAFQATIERAGGALELLRMACAKPQRRSSRQVGAHKGWAGRRARAAAEATKG